MRQKPKKISFIWKTIGNMLCEPTFTTHQKTRAISKHNQQY